MNAEEMKENVGPGAGNSNFGNGTEYGTDARESMWTYEDISKCAGPRKKRQDRETCINNLNVSLPVESIYGRPNVHRNHHKTRSARDALVGSLENVSCNPFGDLQANAEESGLRRCQSLAANGGTEGNSARRHRRSQLIPRAKLIDRPTFKERYDKSYIHQGGHHYDDRTIVKHRPHRNLKDFLAQPQSLQNKNLPSIPIYENPFKQEARPQQENRRSFAESTEVDQNLRDSYENLACPDLGLSLPNYYPDSRCDTDNTDNISLNENLSEAENCSNDDSKTNVFYDDNIVLRTRSPLYDTHYKKPRTIRDTVPFQFNYANGKPQSLPILSDYNSDTEELDDKTVSDPIYDRIDHSIEETNSNFDEINLNNEHIEKEIPVNSGTLKTTSDLVEENPLYDEVPPFLESNPEKPTEEASEEVNPSTKEAIKTSVQVPPPEEYYEDYKTIVQVDLPSTTNQTEEDEEEAKEAKQHSHNYLKEFLESQKGSTKPLQNFITKKISRAFEKDTVNRKRSKQIPSNLPDNQYYSLPDVTVSKNLQKCEKIDRKLRKCDKKSAKPTENRFIVNIGRHFDVTANSNIPVDFEVKISKVPRRRNSSKGKKNEEKTFLDAVKNLKATLNGQKLDRNHNKMVEETINNKEFHEKLGTMRTYWDKMTNGQRIEEPEEVEEKVERIVENAIKKFENKEEKEPEKPPSIVQMTKQVFEPKIEPPKAEKLSNFIREAKDIFENNQDNQFESLNPNIVEIIENGHHKEENKLTKVDRSVSPIKQLNGSENRKKTIRSSSEGPEFDHVRYRVMKSDLFQKKIFANCEKESQFDGLMQYLQDYSFQELLIDNNIVIIEPIRTKIYHETSKAAKTPRNITPMVHKSSETISSNNAGLRRHFFYHPVRVNKEVNDDELPNPDTVKQVRQFFEANFKHSEENIKEVLYDNDPDKDRCSASDSNESQLSDQENLYDSLNYESCFDQQYVSEDVLEKIRQRGTSVTYYGGRVLNKQNGQASLTEAIMDEIRGYEERNYECRCRKASLDKQEKFRRNSKEANDYTGIKFRLLKSNSCSSRLELVGTNGTKTYGTKLQNKQKDVINQDNLDKQNKIEEDNENVEKLEANQPKIVGGEMKKKMTQWNEKTNNNNFATITFSETGKSPQKIAYDCNYNSKSKQKKLDEIEFEHYEVA